MGCAGSKPSQQSIGENEECSCSVLRRYNSCPVHILNSMDNMIDGYKEHDLINERKIFERKRMAKKLDAATSSHGSEVKSKRPPLSPYVNIRGRRLSRKRPYNKSPTPTSHENALPSLSVITNATVNGHDSSKCTSSPKINANKTFSASSLKSYRSTSSLSSNTYTNNSHPNTPRSGTFGLDGTVFEIGVYSKSSGKLKRIIS